MRVPVKLLGFVFWLFFFNCGHCQECPGEKIPHENIEPPVKNSYSDGETVRVNCVPGFTGMYRLMCVKGTWNTINRRPCAKKKCSNPGDIQHGDFRLLSGSEFVFGATVVYTCNKGFEMTSRINQRTCRDKGWDNTLPVCEAVKCPAIHTDIGVTASGNTEEGTYGDVVHFECVSADKKIDGSSEIHCTEAGDWSSPVPTCKDITCRAPEIPNSNFVEPKEYPKDAILKYSCKPGFKPREGFPRCAKFGWTLNPECDELTCVLKSTIFGVKKISPAGKTIFRPGERVEITCTEKHWFRSKESTKSFTCENDGRWDHEPVCEEIRCEDPRDPHMYWQRQPFYVRDIRTLGAKKPYSCISGYNQMAAEATCTRDGWTPKPLCAEIICELTSNARGVKTINPVGKTIFRPRERVTITCAETHQISGTKESFKSFTCRDDGRWDQEPVCEAKQNLCPDLSVKNGLIYHSSVEKVLYSCNMGYKTFTGNWWDSVTCSEGSWSEEPQCIPEDECGAFPSVPHGKLKQMKKISHDGQRVEFECDRGFIPTPDVIKCVNGTWKTPVCEAGVHCDIPPKVENALITSKPEEFYVDGSNVTYVCKSKFTIEGEETISCRNGTWKEEMPTCKEITCELTSTTDRVNNINPADKTIFKPGERVEITCTETHQISGTEESFKSFTCQEDGQWDHEPVCEEIKCKVPDDPRLLRPELYFKGDLRHQWTLGKKIPYLCKSRSEHEATCTRGGWTPKPLCEITCELNSTILGVQKIKPVRTKFFKPGERVEITCTETHQISGTKEPFKSFTCQEDGQWNQEPVCEEITCELKSTTIRVKNINPADKSIFKPGERVEITCAETHQISGTKEPFKSFTCQDDGQWDHEPVCEEIRCEVPDDPRVPKQYFNGDLKLGAKVSYYCKFFGQYYDYLATCTQNGWTPPLCSGMCWY